LRRYDKDVSAGVGGAASAATAIAAGAGADDATMELSEPPLLISGAGHDALAMADACPIGMLFVR